MGKPKPLPAVAEVPPEALAEDRRRAEAMVALVKEMTKGEDRRERLLRRARPSDQKTLLKRFERERARDAQRIRELSQEREALLRASVREHAAAADFAKTGSGLQYLDIKEGTGATPEPGQTVQVHYNGWLDDFGDAGRKFDSSLDRGRPLSFAVGTGRVIKGWDEALLTMKVGGKRRVIIPPELGYGSKGIGPIPGGATLYFEMNLMAVK